MSDRPECRGSAQNLTVSLFLSDPDELQGVNTSVEAGLAGKRDGGGTGCDPTLRFELLGAKWQCSFLGCHETVFLPESDLRPSIPMPFLSPISIDIQQPWLSLDDPIRIDHTSSMGHCAQSVHARTVIRGPAMRAVRLAH